MSHDHDTPPGPTIVPVTYDLEDPEGLTGLSRPSYELKAAIGENLLDLAMRCGINIEHACGGVCACSTCHIYVESGMQHPQPPPKRPRRTVWRKPPVCSATAASHASAW